MAGSICSGSLEFCHLNLKDTIWALCYYLVRIKYDQSVDCRINFVKRESRQF